MTLFDAVGARSLYRQGWTAFPTANAIHSPSSRARPVWWLNVNKRLPNLAGVAALTLSVFRSLRLSSRTSPNRS